MARWLRRRGWPPARRAAASRRSWRGLKQLQEPSSQCASLKNAPKPLSLTQKQNRVPGRMATMKLARWSLLFYRLPYAREVVWSNAVEDSGLFALLRLESDTGV